MQKSRNKDKNKTVIDLSLTSALCVCVCVCARAFLLPLGSFAGAQDINQGVQLYVRIHNTQALHIIALACLSSFIYLIFF